MGVIPFKFRFHVLVGMTFSMIVYAWATGLHPAEVGLRRDTLKSGLLVNTVLSAIFGAILLVLYFTDNIREPTIPSWALFFLFYVFISGPAQEFLFRSMMFAQMARAGIRDPYAVIPISAATYCFLHVIYNDLTTLIATLFMGFVWGVIYWRYPNFYGVALSHSALGVVAIAVGLV
jgi:membrane protease YdiL (CAAX protease family)